MNSERKRRKRKKRRKRRKRRRGKAKGRGKGRTGTGGDKRKLTEKKMTIKRDNKRREQIVYLYLFTTWV